MNKTCRNCHVDFTTNGSGVYCDKCKLVDCVCEKCGKDFERTRTQIVNRSNVSKDGHLFCSKKCAIHYGSLIAAEQRENGEYIKCPNCGKENYKSKADSKRVFCNNRCYGDYRSKNPDKYPSAMNNPATAKKARDTRIARGTNGMIGRRAEKHHRWRGGKVDYRGPSWYETRNKAEKRDKGYCMACKKKGKDVHHIIPFRKFRYVAGENRNDIVANHRNNLIYLCRRCHGYAENHNNTNLPIERVNKAIEHYNKSTKSLAITQRRLF